MRHLGKTVLHGLLLGAAAGALTVGFASTSHAGAVAFSSLQISGFQILKADGSPLSALTDFDVLEVNNFTAAEARLNGSGPTGDNFSPGASDVSMQCTGNCAGIAQNDFNQQGGPIGQFSRADAQLMGDSLGAGITANSVAEVQLNLPSNGSSSSNLGTTSQFSFTPGEDGALRIRFNATPELFAMLEQADVSSFAGMGWHIAISDAVTQQQLFDFAPNGVLDVGEVADGCALNNSVGVNDAGSISYAPGTCFFDVITPEFAANQTLQATIFHETSTAAVVAAAPVPEPAAAGLLGIGMLGLVGLRRRFAKN